jgi:WD40 repeat protein
VQAHTQKVTALVASPDGRVLYSGSNDTAIRRWNAQTGAPMGQPMQAGTQSDDAISSLVLSPDGGVLYSADFNSNFRRWNAHTSEQIGSPMQGYENYGASLALSPDGGVLYAYEYSEHRLITRWNAQTGESIVEPVISNETGDITFALLALSPDGRVLYASTPGYFDVRMWNTQTMTPIAIKDQNRHSEMTSHVVVSPDGRTLYTVTDTRMHRWNAQTGAFIAFGKKYESRHENYARRPYYPISFVILSSDGCWLYSVDKQKNIIHRWNAKTGELERET